MGATDQLQWFDIDDFTAGIWDASAVKGRFAAPIKAFRTLTDYQPIKGGGVRAAFKATTTIDMTGIGANEGIAGIFARNGAFRPSGVGGTGGDSLDMVIVTKNFTDLKYRIYRRDGTVGAPVWSVRSTTTADSGSGHQIVDFAYFKDTAGVEWYLISIFGKGLFAMRTDFTVASNTGNDGLVSTLDAAHGGPVCVSQSRIMLGGGNDDKLYYSDVGATTGLGTNNLQVVPNRALSNISILSGIEPSDLLIGKEGAPWVLVSGDITSTSTPVREMGDDHHQRQDKQQVPRVPGGIAFIEGDGRVFITNDGRTFQSLSDQLAKYPLFYTPSLIGTGTMSYLNSLLFTPGPTGTGTINVFDFDAGCWHRLSDIEYVFGWADPYGGNIWCANHTVTPAIVGISTMGSGSRKSSGIIQTVPYADKNGRNIDIREVQLFVNTYGNSEFKVELLDASDNSLVTRYAVVTGSVHDMVKLGFPATKADYLSVKITATNLAGGEAPTIERLRVGFGINNLIK
jgi:hypothetical protein